MKYGSVVRFLRYDHSKFAEIEMEMTPNIMNIGLFRIKKNMQYPTMHCCSLSPNAFV